MARIESTSMKAIWAVSILAALAFAIPGASTLHAQGPDEAVTVREALERTDEVIARAKHHIEDTRSEKGRIALRLAVELQMKAWNSYRGNGYRFALKLTIEAREEAWHAISLARADTQSEQNLLRVTEETRERMLMVRDLLIDSGVRDEQAMKLLEEARNILDKSRLNAHQNRYQLALKLAMNARQLVARAEEHLRNTRTIKEMVERRIALLERLIERTRDRVRERENDRAHAEIRLAERKLEQARRLYEAGRYREARQACEACERQLRSIVRLVPPPHGDPGAQLEEAHRLLERSREMIEARRERADPKALEAMAQAREMLRKAEAAIGAGRVEEGLALVARVREMLRVSVREGIGALTRERLANRISEIEGIRETALNLASNCPAPGARELVERADGHLRLARENAAGMKLESAAAEAAIARNMYQRIIDLCAR